jgi:hypothetical protein
MIANPHNADPLPSPSSSSSPSSLPLGSTTSLQPAQRPPDEFYIGYDPPMPTGIARFVKRVVVMIGVAAPVAAGGLAIGHARLDGGTFDFGRPRQMTGVIAARPYPAIRLDHVDHLEHLDRDAGESHRNTWALLVAPGKHGADALVAEFDGARVTLEGTRIQRGDRLMFEVTPGSIVRSTATADAHGADTHDVDSFGTDGATVTLRGEIVDSKCHLGVMVPGEGKTHKDCASLCLRGGIPPAVLVRDREGRSALLLLVTPSGDPVGRDAVVRLAGEPVELTGVIARAITPRGTTPAGWPALRTDPSTWRPLPAAR